LFSPLPLKTIDRDSTVIRKTPLKELNRKQLPSIETNTKQSKLPTLKPGAGQSYSKKSVLTPYKQFQNRTPQWLEMKYAHKTGWGILHQHLFMEHYGVNKH
jgi:hypothetical protein